MQDSVQTISLIEFFKLGGWAMWPLLLFSVLTLSLIIERFLSIFIMNNLTVRIVQENVLDFLNKKDIKGAVEYCTGFKKKFLSAHILLSGLKMSKLGEHRMEKAIESEAEDNLSRLERGFNLLVALGSLAPITGFLGTVSGMINAFSSIANATDVNAQLVAKGIYEALITTAYGLVIAVFAISSYYLYSYFVEKFAADIEQAASNVINSVLVINNRENVQ
ncbi:MAG: MotA/TolQ/ExbB proton channel family protein [Spirochaetes bacterium]|nr:MotA/TolQ/ExbB proton channel family protein [Spirochaetota bacterium]